MKNVQLQFSANSVNSLVLEHPSNAHQLLMNSRLSNLSLRNTNISKNIDEYQNYNGKKLSNTCPSTE